MTMTSFTKALYRRDPKAAEAFHRQQSFEHRHTYGRTPTLPQFTLGYHTAQAAAAPHRQAEFGQRQRSMVVACQQSCGHPACSNGCTGLGRQPR
jgi:hypothetical protein